MDAPTDRELIISARRGSAEAYGELVTRYQAGVFNVCYRMTRERREAEDLAQDTFVRVHARLDTFDVEREFGPWVRRVAANLCLNRLEAQKPVGMLDEERDADPAQSPEAALEVRERSEQIRAALASLPPRWRAVVELRHYQELSYEEIGRALGLPISDVKSHLFRARKILAEKLHAPD